MRRLIAEAIRRSPLKRAAIAEALTAKLGIRITEHMLNDFTSDNKKGVRFPLLFSSALCEILDDDSIGLFGVRPHIRRLVEFAERELHLCRDQRERECLRETLLSELSRERKQARSLTYRQPTLPLGEPK
ncbi:MAG: hypothetical protein ACJ71W_17455 [Terriglobales bacterium]